MLLATRSELEDVRRDQDQLRGSLEALQHGRGGAPAQAGVPAAQPSPPGAQQRWPADPWGSPDPFSSSGVSDLNAMQPGQAVSPTGAPVPPSEGPMPPPIPTPMGSPTPAQAAPTSAPPAPGAAGAPPPPAPLPGASGGAQSPAVSGQSAPGPLVAAATAPGAAPAMIASVRGSGTGAAPAMTAPTIAPPVLPDSAKATLYAEGVAAFNAGHNDEAIQHFRDYVHAEPESDLADDAQFWIGECYVRKGQYNNAIKEFNQVVLRYGSGDRSAASLLKLAEVFSKMGDQVDARLSLQKLVNRYPGSSEAGQAYKMLQEMGG